MSVHSYQAADIRGQEVSLDTYKGKVLLIVNTASKCGLTPQYADLQKLYEKYRDEGLVVLGFPCNQFGGQEPEDNDKVEEFCQLNYSVTFPLFGKLEVRGEDKHPLFAHLTAEAPFGGFDRSTPGGQRMHERFSERTPDELNNNEIKWNFTKFLVDRDGRVVKRFESPVVPSEIEPAIEAALQS